MYNASSTFMTYLKHQFTTKQSLISKYYLLCTPNHKASIQPQLHVKQFYNTSYEINQNDCTLDISYPYSNNYECAKQSIMVDAISKNENEYQLESQINFFIPNK